MMEKITKTEFKISVIVSGSSKCSPIRDAPKLKCFDCMMYHVIAQGQLYDILLLSSEVLI